MPRSLWHYSCKHCGVKLEYHSFIYWGIQLAQLLLVLSIYKAVEGSWNQSLLAFPAAAVFLALEFRFARIVAVKP
jgi:hypothetical protein